MVPQTHDIASDLQLQEFTVPCAHPSCSQDATWAIRTTHGEQCPQDGFICTACKTYLVASWSDALRRGDIRCANCHVGVTGCLSDHLTFVCL